MNKVRKDLGLSYDSNCLYDSCDVSFNSQADLVASKKKNYLYDHAGLPDELILDKNDHEYFKEEGDLLSAIEVNDLSAKDETKKRKKKAKKSNFSNLLGEEYLDTPE